MSYRNPNCTACPLHRTAKTVCIPGDGPQDAEVLVIGQNPGREEDRRGKPFIGASGTVLKAALTKAGFDTSRVRFTNVTRCLTPNNRPPTPQEVKACAPYLQAELAAVRAPYLLPLGAIACKAVTKEVKITTAHGKFIERDGRVMMPTYHPAAGLRDPSKLTVMQQDFERLHRRMQGTYGKAQDAFTWRCILHKRNLPELWEDLDSVDEYAFDTETSGLLPQAKDFVLRSIALALPHCVWVIPLEMPGSAYEMDFPAQQAFFKVLRRKVEGKWAATFHGKFDSGAIHTAYGVRLHYDFDAMLAHHVLDENQDHDLKYVARMELDCPEYDLPKDLKLSDKPEWYEKMQDRSNRVKYWEYNARDAWNTLYLAKKFERQLARNAALRRLFYRLSMPSSRALQTIEGVGMPVDEEKYAAITHRVKIERETQLQILNRVAQINWGSRDQVAEVLFDQLKLPSTLKTPTGKPSTSEEALVDLKGKHTLINELLKYRELDKILGTYLEGWKEFIVNGRIYFSYKQHGTVTGRFSSRLHQIPTNGDIRSIISGVEI